MPPIIDLHVQRDRVVAFALYTHDAGVLKLTAQLYPLRPDEAKEARLEVERDGAWTEVANAPVLYPGWSAHFRVERWDGVMLTGLQATARDAAGTRAIAL